MMRLHVCQVCSSYTMEREHCKERTRSAHPQRFDPDDRYGKYRRIWKGVC